jgi:hypothetical protein
MTIQKERFEKLCKLDRTSDRDVERKSLFYILAGNDDLWNKRNAIYDTEDRSIHLNFDELADFGSSSRKLIELAFSLYNGYKADVLNTFSGLDEENFDLAIDALRMRFNQ